MVQYKIKWKNPDKVHWDFKQKCVAHLLLSNWNVKRKYVLYELSGDVARSQTALQSCSQFFKSFPDAQSLYFYIFVDMYNKLDCADNSQDQPAVPSSESILELVGCTPERFCELVGKKHQNKAKAFLKNCNPRPRNFKIENALSSKPTTSIGGVPAFFQSDIPNIDMEKCASDKKLDQRTFYLHPQSAKNWGHFILDPKYTIYRQCENSLIDLLSDSEFQKNLSDSNVNKVVMLGGAGCSSKDVKILSLIGSRPQFSPQNPLTFLLFDLSQWMLSKSLAELAPIIKNKGTNPWANNVILRAGIGDFMKMRRLKGHFRRDANKVLWGLTGAIFANVSEKKLMDSLNEVAEIGDQLILSVSIVPDGKEPQPVNFSNNNQTKVMLRGPLTELLSENELTAQLPKVSGRDYTADDVFHEGLMNDRITDNGTDIPSSHATEVHCTITGVNGEKVDIILHTHVQYNVKALKDFMFANGKWKFEQLVTSGKSLDYAQIVFHKIL